MKLRPCSYVYLLFFLFMSMPILPTDALVSPIPSSHNSSDFSNKSSPPSYHPVKIDNTTAEYLDSLIQKYAFEALTRGTKTGIVYKVPLPANLSGIHSWVVRVRSRTLWVNGLTIGSVHIPPKTVSVPPLKRMIVVYQNLGHWSHLYYKVQNYTLATPVLGLSVYDDGNGTRVELGTRGNGSIVVSFWKGLELSKKGKCTTFGLKGSQRLDSVVGNNTCLSGNSGHFSIVVPEKAEPVPRARKVDRKKKRKRWVVWAVGGGVAVTSLVLLCLLGVGITKCVKERKMEEMTKRAEEDEVLDVVWVNGRKMPNASMMRTQPVLENAFAP